jgi:hypothetical protein
LVVGSAGFSRAAFNDSVPLNSSAVRLMADVPSKSRR